LHRCEVLKIIVAGYVDWQTETVSLESSVLWSNR